jgi:transposase
MEMERVEQALAALSQKPTQGEVGLTDAQWAQIEAVLPPRRQGRGRPRADDRRTLEAILYVQQTGCTWAELPAVLGDEATAHRRWQEWRAAGLWERIAAIVQAPSAMAGHPWDAEDGARLPARVPRAAAAHAQAIIETAPHGTRREPC